MPEIRLIHLIGCFWRFVAQFCDRPTLKFHFTMGNIRGGADALFENIGNIGYCCSIVGQEYIGSRMMQMQYWISRSCYLIRNGFWDFNVQVFELYAFFDCITIYMCLLITRFRFFVYLLCDCSILFERYFVDIIHFSLAILFTNDRRSCNQFTRKEYH